MDQIAPKKQGPHRFEKGREKTHGRVKGSRNKVPRLLRECIMEAAEAEGSNQHGKEGLIGFLRKVAREDLRGFVMLLGRVMPLQIEAQSEVHVEVTYRSIAEVRREMEHRGISMELVSRLIHQPSAPVDHEGIEYDPDDRD